MTADITVKNPTQNPVPKQTKLGVGQKLAIRFFDKTFPDNKKEKQNRKILYFLFFCVRLADSINTLKS
jgi:hypothetical protein